MSIQNALGGASLIGAGANIWGAKKSADAQAKAAKQATALAREQFLRGLEEVKPFKDAGMSVLPNITAAANEQATPFSFRDSSAFLNDYFNSPEYQTLNAQATDQILRNRSVTGGLRSGGASVDLANIAPTIGIDALNRINQQDMQAYGINEAAKADRFQRLYGLANMGANAASGNQVAAMNFGSTAANNAIAAGNARANKYANYAKTINGLVDDGASIYSAGKMGII